MSATTHPPPPGYTTTGRLLHWIVAVMVLATIPIATVMIREGITRSTQDTLFILHKNGGVIILLLVLARIGWRLTHPPPPLPATVPPIQQFAARAVHLGLYAMLIFMAATGYTRVAAGGFPIEMLDALGVPRLAPRSDALAETAQTLHRYGRLVLIALIFLHVGAALFHAVVLRDGVFSRMWPPVRGRGG
jgi:cytochrome b561